MSEFPAEFLVATKPQPTRYVLAGDYDVVPGGAEDRRQPDVVFYLEEERLVVRRKQQTAKPRPGASPTGPVYRVGARGPLAVPTGKVFVRFAEGQSVDGHRQEIEDAGFRIIEALSYAPQAGWLEASSGEITDAISRFADLNRISGIETVEPQMLMERQAR